MDFDPRDHESRDRDVREAHDPRDAFARDLYLPSGADREVVRDREHEYSLKITMPATLRAVRATGIA
jgi:hypothetical protein